MDVLEGIQDVMEKLVIRWAQAHVSGDEYKAEELRREADQLRMLAHRLCILLE